LVLGADRDFFFGRIDCGEIPETKLVRGGDLKLIVLADRVVHWNQEHAESNILQLAISLHTKLRSSVVLISPT